MRGAHGEQLRCSPCLLHTGRSPQAGVLKQSPCLSCVPVQSARAKRLKSWSFELFWRVQTLDARSEKCRRCHTELVSTLRKPLIHMKRRCRALPTQKPADTRTGKAARHCEREVM